MIQWGDVVQGSGSFRPWGVLTEGRRILVVGSGNRDVLGWAVAETIGKLVFSLVDDEGSGKRVMEEWTNRGGNEILKVKCEMVGSDGQRRPVEVMLYHSCE